MPPRTPCPDVPSLERLLLGQVHPPDSEPLYDHLGACDRCAEYARTYRTDDAVSAALRGATADDDAEDPSVAGLVAELTRRGPAAGADDLKATALSLTTPPFGGGNAGREDFDFLAPAEAADEIGRLGGYRVLGVLGAGGMGVVFHAEDPALQRPVALKAMRPGLAGGDAARRFLDEARAAAALHHDHVVAIFQVGEERGVPFLVMPLLQGESLEDRLRRAGPLPPAEVCRVGREIARGLEAAHARGLVHRDVKPANVWLESGPGGPGALGEPGASAPGGRVKILDFGLALSVGGAAESAVAGTPAYMAPEQAAGRPVDGRADLFALGCLLYHAVTGAPPFRGATAAAVLAAVAKEDPPPPVSVNPAVPPALSALVMRLLAKDPAGRPASAREVAEALAKAEAAARRRRRPWRRWALRGATAVLLLGAAAATAARVVVPTDRGEVSIETDDPDVEVVAKGERIVRIIDPKTGRSYQLDRDDLTLTRTDDPDGLAVTLDGGRPVVLKRDGRRLVTLRLAAKSGDTAGEVAGFREVHGATESDFVAWADGQAKDGFRVASLSACAGASPPRFNGIAVRDDRPPPTAVRVGLADDESLNYFRAMSGKGYRISAVAVYNVRGERRQAEIWVRDGLAFGGYGTTLAALPSFLDAAARAKGLMPVSISTELGTRDLSVTTCLALAPARGVAWETAGGLSADGLRQRADAYRARGWRLTHVAAYLDGTAERFLTVAAENPDGVEWQCRADLSEADYGRALRESGGRGLRPAATASYRHGDEVRYAAVWEGRPAREKDIHEIRQFAGHRGPVRSAAFSPDGRYALSASGYPDGDNTARLWDAATGEEIRRFEGHTAPVEVAAFTPDGKRVLTAAKDRTIRLWDAATGKERRRLDLADTWAMSLAVSPDGRRALGGCGDHLVRLWDLEDWKEVGRFEGHAHWVTAVAFSPDGRRGLSGDWDGVIQLWDLETRRKVRRFTGHERMVWAVAFLPGDRLLSAGDDGTIRLWDVETGEGLRRLEGHAMPVYGMALSADGRRALTGGGDGTVRLWDMDGGQELACFRGRPEVVWSVAFSPDGRLALSGGGGVLRGGEWTAGGDWDLHLWRLPDADGAPKGEENGPPPEKAGEVRRWSHGHGYIQRIVVSADGRSAWTSGDDFSQWDLATGERRRRVPTDNWAAEELLPSPDGKTLLFTDVWGGGARLVDAASAKVIRPLVGGPARFWHAAWLTDGRRLLTGGEDGVVRLWDAGEGKVLREFRGLAPRTHCSDVNRDGTLFLTFSFEDATIRVWSLEKGKEDCRVADQCGLAWFTPDGRAVLTPGRDGIIRLIAVPSGKELKSFHSPGKVVAWDRLVLMADGRHFLSSGADQILRLWDLETGRQIYTADLPRKAMCLAASPDGRYAFVGSDEGTIVRWRLPDLPPPGEVEKEAVRHLPWPENPHVYQTAFSPDGRHLAAVGDNPAIRVWEVKTGALAQEIRLPGDDGWFTGVWFSSDGKRILAGKKDGAAYILDAATGAELHRFTGHQGAVWALRLSPDGRLAVTTGADGTIRVWDVGTGRELHQEGAPAAVGFGYFAPDGRHILSGGKGDVLRLWEARTGKDVRTFEGHAGNAYLLGPPTDAKHFVSYGDDFDLSIREWDLETGKQVHQLSLGDGRGGIAMTPDGRRVLVQYGRLLRMSDPATGDVVWEGKAPTASPLAESLSPDGRLVGLGSVGDGVYLLRLPDPPPAKAEDKEPPPKNPDEVRRFAGHTDWVLNARFHPDGRRVFSASCDGTVRLWDQETGETLRVFAGLPGNVRGLALTADGKRVAGGAANVPGGAPNFLRLWGVETGAKVRDFPVPTGILSVDLSPDGRRLLAGGEDGVGRVFDVGTGEEVCRFEEHTGNIHAAIFSKDGRLAFTGSRDQSVRMWDTETGKEVRRFVGHTGWVLALALSPDGRRLLSGGDKTVRVWDVETGRQVHCFEGYKDYVLSVAFSPDGRRILSGDFGNQLRLWEADTGRVLQDRAPGGTVEVVRFSADGRRVLFGGNDNVLRLWRLPEAAAPKDK